MKILLTGATGYIAQRLLPVLLNEGHEVVCCVRDKNRFNPPYDTGNLKVVQVDFLKKETLSNIPHDIDAAYYLIHSMAADQGSFQDMEQNCARNFASAVEQTRARQVVYLSGIVNEEKLSKHLSSRKNVEDILTRSDFNVTILRAGIIVGSGSASFEIIRDLVEKLPVMIAPKWLKTKCQPIGIRNVIEFLSHVIKSEKTYNETFDIGGPDILSYKEMLLRFAEVRKLKRSILVVPVMSPRISSYWLYFVTATSYKLAQNLVDSMKVEVICRPNNLAEELGIKLLGYKESIELAFEKIEQNQVVSSWTDAQNTELFQKGISRYIQVPTFGCYKDVQKQKTQNPEKTLDKIWRIGGNNGWYYANFLWEIRGILDKTAGGPGMRRGRRSDTEISAGDSLDFWRVLVADKENKRLLLYAEMKLPGEAWLEFTINDENTLTQTATFRPLGLLGRLYWYSVLPFHGFIFKGMIKSIVE